MQMNDHVDHALYVLVYDRLGIEDEGEIDRIFWEQWQDNQLSVINTIDNILCDIFDAVPYQGAEFRQFLDVFFTDELIDKQQEYTNTMKTALKISFSLIKPRWLKEYTEE